VTIQSGRHRVLSVNARAKLLRELEKKTVYCWREATTAFATFGSPHHRIVNHRFNDALQIVRPASVSDYGLDRQKRVGFSAFEIRVTITGWCVVPIARRAGDGVAILNRDEWQHLDRRSEQTPNIVVRPNGSDTGPPHR
jgi:hypothetical protein